MLAGGDRLLIVPDGPLHLLPFGALTRTEGERHFVAEWMPLHITLSATVFAELRKSREGGEGAERVGVRVAAFGDPSYPRGLRDGEAGAVADAQVRNARDRCGFAWSPLPYTSREVTGIAESFAPGATRVYLGAEATEERAKSLTDDTSILHFAVHSCLDDRFPLNSALALTIPEVLEDGRDNGLLQVWEIFENVRLDADLVVLSACATALGQEQSGEGLIGLTRAFQYAGARSVVASLWTVRDQVTAELMVRFYRHLRSGLPKDEALRAAQLELIRGPVEVTGEHGRRVAKDWSAPYYWAAFQIYGDWR